MPESRAVIVVHPNERFSRNGVMESLYAYMGQMYKWEANQLQSDTHGVGDITINRRLLENEEGRPVAADEVNEVLRYVIERKTVEDLFQSMMATDNRFEQQSTELIKIAREYPQTRCGFLIEGAMTQGFHQHLSVRHVRNKLLDLSYAGLHVWYTQDVDDTVHFLCHLRSLVDAVPTPDIMQQQSMINVKKFAIRKSEIDDAEQLPQTLKLINGVSGPHALAITQEYKSIGRLAAALWEDPKVLVGMQIDEKRKIGDRLAQKIYGRFWRKRYKVEPKKRRPHRSQREDE